MHTFEVIFLTFLFMFCIYIFCLITSNCFWNLQKVLKIKMNRTQRKNTSFFETTKLFPLRLYAYYTCMFAWPGHKSFKYNKICLKKLRGGGGREMYCYKVKVLLFQKVF